MARKSKQFTAPAPAKYNLTVRIPMIFAPLTDRLPFVSLAYRWSDFSAPASRLDLPRYMRERQPRIGGSWNALMTIALTLFLVSMIAVRLVFGYPRANEVYPWVSAPLFGVAAVCAILGIVEIRKREANAIDFWLI